MRFTIYYIITLAWGLVTPALALGGAKHFLYSAKENIPVHGRSTPLEFVALALLIGAACVLGFFVFNCFYAAFILPTECKRMKHFFLNLLLFIFLIFGGWFIVAFFAGVMGF